MVNSKKMQKMKFNVKICICKPNVILGSCCFQLQSCDDNFNLQESLVLTVFSLCLRRRKLTLTVKKM